MQTTKDQVQWIARMQSVHTAQSQVPICQCQLGFPFTKIYQKRDRHQSLQGQSIQPDTDIAELVQPRHWADARKTMGATRLVPSLCNIFQKPHSKLCHVCRTVSSGL